MATQLLDLCYKLSHDASPIVQGIGRQCLRTYDEFQGLRYAGLTNRDLGSLTDAAVDARAHEQTVRALLLDEAVIVVRALLPGGQPGAAVGPVPRGARHRVT